MFRLALMRGVTTSVVLVALFTLPKLVAAKVSSMVNASYYTFDPEILAGVGIGVIGASIYVIVSLASGRKVIQ